MPHCFERTHKHNWITCIRSSNFTFAERYTKATMIPFNHAEATVYFNPCPVNFNIGYLRQADESLSKLRSLICRNLVRQTCVVGYAALDDCFPDILGGHVTKKSCSVNLSTLFNNWEYWLSIQIHYIQHNPLVEVSMLGSKRNSKAI